MTLTIGARLDQATQGLPAPLAVVDLDAVDANATDLVRRAGGTPIRVASKSVRVRAVLQRVLARQGFAGVMAYSLREALWLVSQGVDDVLMGYPTVDTDALDKLAADPAAVAAVTLMVDDPAQVDLAARSATAHGVTVRLCLDVDASLRVKLGPLAAHLGVRRSPVHTPADAGTLAAAIAERPGVDVVGVMFYEAQVAGLPDTSAAVRAVKRLSIADLASRRAAVVAAVEAAVGHPLELVNSGGSGSVASSAADPAVTEVTAGSGLFVPTLFDAYRSFTPRPAAFFGLDVVRIPGPGFATAFGGGYIASGPSTKSRQPRPVWPGGLALTSREGAGEVQTPLRLSGGTDLRIGDRVWFRHAKSGEVMERFESVHLVRGAEIEATVPTYRGEGHTFG
ncbi:alanine racemase [Cellulomonas sp. McL0617]|uniref:alanine racemase n=1 Tax=Cellulomonas sp. McL0617 TaxID=3415675 RepID=UPI003CF20107